MLLTCCRHSRIKLRQGTDLPKIRSLQFACLVAAFSIAAAYQIISGKTMSVASPEDADEVEVGSVRIEQLRHLRIACPAWAVALTQRGN